MTDPLKRLHEDHRVLDEQMAQFERLVREWQAARPGPRHQPRSTDPCREAARQLRHLTDQLTERLSAHIRFEEASFYAPLTAAGRTDEQIAVTLRAEHDELLKTLERLQRCWHRSGPEGPEQVLAAYATHLIEVYREHTEREHAWLFPLLEQPPRPVVADPEAPVTRTTTLNALIRRFPQLLDALHLAGLDTAWQGSDTIEEVAWYSGIELESLLSELNRRIARKER